MKLVASAGLVDLAQGQVSTATGAVPLSDLERSVVRYLHAERHRPVSRDELLEQVWGYRRGVQSRTVDMTIQRLRTKIEADPNRPVSVVTVRGEGYQWAGADEDPTAPIALPPIPRLDALVGRRSELRDLQTAARDGRLVAVTGPPGVGKTWVARAFLTGIRDAGRAGAWFASVEGRSTRADLRDAVAAALGVGAAGIEAQLGAPTVGVIDGADALAPDAAAQLSAWIRGTSATRLVVTSQRPLLLEGEHRIVVEPLDPDAAAHLLSVRIAQLGLPPLADPSPLVTLADGLPLALELVAPLLEVLPVDRIAQTDPLGWASDRPDVPERHRSLSRAVAVALDALPERTRALAARLSVFAAEFDLDAVEQAADGRPEDLALLARRSLVRRIVPDRFALYDAVRRAAARSLPSDERAQLEARYDAWLVSRFDPRARNHGARLRPYRADLVHAIGRARPEDLPPLVGSLSEVVDAYGLADELAQAIDRALTRTDLPPMVRSNLLRRRAKARVDLGDLAGCLADATEALTLPCSVPTEVALWCALSRAALDQGQPDEAVRCGRRAHERAVGVDPLVEMHALVYLATAMSAVDGPASRPFHTRAAELALAADRPIDAAAALLNGANALPLAERAQAVPEYEHAVALAQDSPRLRGIALGNLARTWFELGDVARSEATFAQADRELRVGNDPRSAAQFSVDWAVTTAAAGSVERSAGMLAAALDALRTSAPEDWRKAARYAAALRGEAVPPASEWEVAPIAVLARAGAEARAARRRRP